jgi:cobalt/nickel transport system permease protein
VHIPEGALSPQTYGPAYAAMAPIWVLAGRAMQRRLSARKVPLLAIGAAFSFLIMMFNVPIPGGTTGHATGAALIAILLGPWAAVVAVSVVLAVQAFLFQDGGITSLAANCFNMAFLMPMASYAVYRAVAWRSGVPSPRRILAAGIAGYIGLNVAALSAAVMFGIQPYIAHAPDGHPLYFPYDLRVAVPAMMAEHLLIFGFVEAVVTAGAVAYLARTEPQLLGAVQPAPSGGEGT